MRLQILYDNHAVNGFASGWGFACLVDGHVLFDTGEAPAPLLENLARAGLTPEAIDRVVISHDHWDHTGGLWDLLRQRPNLTVYACPGFGPGFSARVAELGGRLVVSRPNLEVAEGISVTGEIAATYKDDPMPEQALVGRTPRGLVVVTGCSHPGILEVLRAVRARVDPAAPLELVLGGFHLFREPPAEIDAVVEAFASLGVRRVGPTHCSGDAARARFRARYGERFLPLGAGAMVEIEDGGGSS